MDQEVSIDVEADTFFAYNNLISECRDLFIRQMDSSSTGLRGVVMNLDHKITEFLPEVAIHFVRYLGKWLDELSFIHSFTHHSFSIFMIVTYRSVLTNYQFMNETHKYL